MERSSLRTKVPGLIKTAVCGPARTVVWQPGLAYWVSPRRADYACSLSRKNAVDFSVASGLPAVFGNIPAVRECALAGIQWDWSRAGEMCAERADAILKGGNPQAIPIETPDEFKICINLKTAQKFNLDIPYAWLEAASDLVE